MTIDPLTTWLPPSLRTTSAGPSVPPTPSYRFNTLRSKSRLNSAQKRESVGVNRETVNGPSSVTSRVAKAGSRSATVRGKTGQLKGTGKAPVKTG